MRTPKHPSGRSQVWRRDSAGKMVPDLCKQPAPNERERAAAGEDHRRARAEDSAAAVRHVPIGSATAMWPARLSNPLGWLPILECIERQMAMVFDPRLQGADLAQQVPDRSIEPLDDRQHVSMSALCSVISGSIFACCWATNSSVAAGVSLMLPLLPLARIF